MDSELVKRYIYAVVCHLPEKIQSEVERELESVIEELLDARCADSEPTKEDIKAVLTQLGAPEELAVKYSGDKNKALISGVYLLWFKRTLKIVLPIVAAAAVFGAVLSLFKDWNQMQEAGAVVFNSIIEIISVATSSVFGATMWIALAFIVMESQKMNFSDRDFLSELPKVPDKRMQIKPYDPVIDIFWYIATAVLFLAYPSLIGSYWGEWGWIPIFDLTYIQAFWYLVVAWTVIGIIGEVFKLIDRRYSKKVAFSTIVT